MTFSNNVRGPSNSDSDPDDTDIVQTYTQFVYDVARQIFPCSTGYVDSDDLAQESLLKLHLASQKMSIISPKAYIRQLVCRQAIDMWRKDKRHLHSTMDDEGELCQGKPIVSMSGEYANPEEIVVEREKLKEAVEAVIEVVSGLHQRQKLAAACTLHSRADIPELEESLSAIGIDRTVKWSEDGVEKQKLQSSYAPVRKKLAVRFGVELKKSKQHSS